MLNSTNNVIKQKIIKKLILPIFPKIILLTLICLCQPSIYKIKLYLCRSYCNRVALVWLMSHSCRTLVARVTHVLHSCRTCVTRVALVPLMSLLSGTRVVKQTRSCETPVVPFLTSIDHTIIFIQKTLHSSLISKQICALHRRNFQKHLLFTTFLLVLTMDEVCNISNKYWHPKKLGKYYFFTQQTHSPPSFRNEIHAVCHKCFSKRPFFTTFLVFNCE